MINLEHLAELEAKAEKWPNNPGFDNPDKISLCLYIADHCKQIIAELKLSRETIKNIKTALNWGQELFPRQAPLSDAEANIRYFMKRFDEACND